MRALQQILNEVKPPSTRLAGIEFLEKVTGVAAKADGRDRYVFGVDLDEVYPGLFIGDEGAARNVEYLKYLGITHVLNAAEGVGFGQVSTSEEFYRPHGLRYKGLMLEDVAHTDMISQFDPASEFIDAALQSSGKVLVHCLMGMSRSATLAIGFLMLRRGMTVEQALTTVRGHRGVRPNNGFLHQLIQLDNRIRTEQVASL
ncbi:dual specificity protein phosphatase 3-like [Tropilaelaps mercedesae]|uniref:Dual specificity protein phosphatase n=1 Tax=Tropilaelaps mercedesae TaxID=418985 RepID=A0A1V9XLH6_9ACAR|nr:dual specificity protein phosphatase 3-like [Tropilaelaps mercedesae]